MQQKINFRLKIFKTLPKQKKSAQLGSLILKKNTFDSIANLQKRVPIGKQKSKHDILIKKL